MSPGGVFLSPLDAYIGVDARYLSTPGYAVDFKTASDRLRKCHTLADVARVSGAAEPTIRQARLDPSSSSYRKPPEGWQAAIAKLARERAGELLELAEELE